MVEAGQLISPALHLHLGARLGHPYHRGIYRDEAGDRLQCVPTGGLTQTGTEENVRNAAEEMLSR